MVNSISPVPKRPMNPYMLYANEHRENLKAKNPNISITELAKLLGENFKAISDKDKKKYQDIFDKNKASYKTEMEAYEKKHGKVVKE